MVDKGDPAPDFHLPDQDGVVRSLSDHRGKYIVLYFYPRAFTPGCTREATRFNELYDRFMEHGVVVLGISTDSVEKLRRFREKHGLRFTLLSDQEARVVEKYGVLKKGARKPSAVRTTFIIDPDGLVVEVLRNIRPAERHADKALEIVEKLLSS